MIRFVCWSCGKSLKAQPAHAGLKCNCNGCGESNTIPSHGIEVDLQPTGQPSSRPPPGETKYTVEVDPPAKIPPRANEVGKVFCYKCGASIFEEAEICPHCGVRQKRATTYSSPHLSLDGPNKVVAAMLAIFLGLIGAHKFYLGQFAMGCLYLVIGTFGWVIFWIVFFIPQFVLAVICIIEGIIYLSMSDADFAEKYGQAEE